MRVTTTGPRWLCQGNCAPGCTVYLTLTVRDGSSTWTTVMPWPCSLSLSFMSISSGKTARGVSGSARIGGGGSTAADGMTLTAEAAASIKSVVPRMSMALLRRLLPLFIFLLLSRWDGAPLPMTLETRRPAAYGGRRPAPQAAALLPRRVLGHLTPPRR